jgi:hypothetical protein
MTRGPDYLPESAEPAAIGVGETYRRCLHIMASSPLVRGQAQSGLAELGGAAVARAAVMAGRRKGLVRACLPVAAADGVEPEAVTLASLGGAEGIREAVRRGIENGLMTAGQGEPLPPSRESIGHPVLLAGSAAARRFPVCGQISEKHHLR